MKNPNRLKAEWQTFFRKVLPDGASEVQIQEMRRAFYAGADCLLTLMMRQLEPGTEPTDGDLAMMDDISAEIKEFAQDIQKGNA